MSKPHLLLIFISILTAAQSFGQKQEKMTYEQYVREGIPSQKEIDVFLNELSWAQFDPELGYILGNYMPHDGFEGSATISTSQKNGARTAFVYADRPCRINTYGNSFTQCHQASDAETWQEYLAGHLGEPVRNFGMGGYGTYQAYRRMLREEATENSAENIVLYIWGGDHIRSLMRCRYMAFRKWRDRNAELEGEGIMFHGNFWANLEMDLQTGQFVEHESRVQSPEALYNMVDPDWLAENLEGDWALQMYLFIHGEIEEVDIHNLQKLSRHLGLEQSWDHENLHTTVAHLLDKYSFAATQFILNKARAFAEAEGKNLLIVLFDPYRVLRSLLEGQARYDQEIVDFLKENAFNYFDMNTVHLADYQDFNLSIDDYFQRYFIGHYNPMGNHFFAYKIKSAIVEMLDPKPITYSKKETQMINFKAYLDKY